MRLSPRIRGAPCVRVAIPITIPFLLFVFHFPMGAGGIDYNSCARRRSRKVAVPPRQNSVLRISAPAFDSLTPFISSNLYNGKNINNLSWWAREESNLRPQSYQDCALPLSHAPKNRRIKNRKLSVSNYIKLARKCNNKK